jgi:hypothetical protein
VPVNTQEQAMKNSELFAAPKHLLGGLDKQRQYVMKIEMARKACPNCGELHNVPEAAGVAFDDYDFSAADSDRKGPCRKCKRTLIFTVPLMGDWFWRLDPNEARTPSDA